MNTKITLTNPTDDELSAAVANYVAKISTEKRWRYFYNGIESGGHISKMAATADAISHSLGYGAIEEYDYVPHCPPYATSADAVLPLLEKVGRWSLAYNLPLSIGGYSVMVSDACSVAWWAEDPAFPRAACIALLRANGVEVVT